MRLVVPYRSHREVRFIIDEYGLRPTILLVLVPGVREGGYLEPAPEVTAEDIPHVWGGGVPSHLVPVGPDGSIEDIALRSGDQVLLSQEAPSVLVWAAARLSENLGRGSVSITDGERIVVMTPVVPAGAPV